MIDLPKSSPATAGGPANRSATAVEAHRLAARLGVRVGQVVPAEIKSASALSQAEREYLVNQASARIELNASGANKPELLKAALAQASRTQLLSVEINGKAAALLSDLALGKGQVISVRVRLDGQLQVLAGDLAALQKAGVAGQAPAQTQLQLQRPLASSPPAPFLEATQRTGQLANPTLAAIAKLSQHYGTQSPEGLTSRTSLEAAINKLPSLQQQQVRDLRAAIRQVDGKTQPLAKLVEALQALPERVPRAWLKLAPEYLLLAKRLHPLKHAAVDLTRLGDNPEKALREALSRSGTLLERHLRDGQFSERPETLAQDIKRNLLLALESVQKLLDASARGLEPGAKAGLEPLLKLLLSFAKPSSAPRAAALEASLRALQTQLRGALAQIQVQQYRSTLPLVGDPQLATPSLLLDIPVRWFDGFGSVAMVWQQYRAPEEEDNKKRKRKPPKHYWRVYMELVLEQSETLGIDLGICEKQMDAKMWASSKNLQQRATSGLQQLTEQLRARGLTVKEIHCEQTDLPHRPTGMELMMINERT